MSRIVPSGHCYPNKMGRIIMTAIEEILGKNGINALLRLAGLEHRVDNYPPNNLNKEWDFAEFSALDQALDDMVGSRGGRALSLRAGQAVFNDGLQGFATFVGMSDLAFRVLPQGTKVRVGLRAMAEVFTKFSDQPSHVVEEERRYVYVIERCPVCWRRKADKPICHIAAGLIQEGLKWVSGGKIFRVAEFECVAHGGRTCSFEVPKEPIG